MHNCRGSGRHRIRQEEGCALIRAGLAALFVLIALTPARSQTPQEHEQHHPATPAPSLVPPGDQPATPTEPGQAGSAMDEMMQRMGAPPPKALYPSLMEFPELTSERRAELERLAQERMIAGSVLMSAGVERLSTAARENDFAAMQEASAQVREGLAHFESGLATRRALAEGRAPRDLALDWFRREMNLPLSEVVPAQHGLFGLSWFHYISMFILASFATAMLWMYFHKMRRAEALLTALATAQAVPGASSVPQAPPAPPPPASIEPPPAPSSPPAASSRGERWVGHLRVAAVVQESPDVKTFRLVDPNGDLLPFSHLPGQFLTLTVEIDGKTTKRAYTIASPPTRRDAVEITVKREPLGVVSQYLHDRLKVGDELTIAAPAGYFTFTGHEADSIVLIGGGVGVTPLMSVIRYLTDREWPGDIFLLFSCKASRDVLFRQEIERLKARCPNLHVTVITTREARGNGAARSGRVTPALIGNAVPAIASRRVHLCGPPPMMEAVKQMLGELGIPASQIKTENFGTATRSPAAAATRLVPPPAPDAGPAPLPPAGVPRATRPAAIAPTASATLPTVTFARSHKAAPAAAKRTVLDIAEEVGVDIDSACRSGTCGTCKVTLTSGHVTMALDDALEPSDRASNMILACQAIPGDNVVVEA